MKVGRRCIRLQGTASRSEPLREGGWCGDNGKVSVGREPHRGPPGGGDVRALTCRRVIGDPWTVGKIVAVRASRNSRVQQLPLSGLQQVPRQSLRNNRFQQISIGLGIWFGTRGSEVQILSPRPFFSSTYVRLLVCRPQRCRQFCSCRIPCRPRSATGVAVCQGKISERLTAESVRVSKKGAQESPQSSTTRHSATVSSARPLNPL